MIGMVLVTHGNLAREFFSALEHIVGPQEQVEAIGIGADEDMAKCRGEIEKAIARVNSGEGVILLTDLFGGTPSNMAISMMQNSKVEVIAGINLPLLVKLASVRKEKSLEEAAVKAQESGRKYIEIASRLLSEGP